MVIPTSVSSSIKSQPRKAPFPTYQFQLLHSHKSQPPPSSPLLPSLHPHIHFSQFSCSPAMGNGLAKVTHCFCGAVPPHGAAVTSEPFDEGLGHSFCYVRPEPIQSFSGNSSLSSKVHHHEETTTFRTISGASVSANTATPLSTSVMLNDLTWPAAAAFESSISIAAVPLQPVPRLLSGPLDRGFLSGPIERGFMSGPLDPTLFSGPLPGGSAAAGLRRSLSYVPRSRRAAANIFRHLTKALSRRKSKESDGCGSSRTDGAEFSTSDQIDSGDGSLHWAQGKAGEDRVHVVISEEHGWVFVGIYDGFNGPDATDYLLSNLYSAVQQELKGLLWQESSQFDNQSPADTEINVSAADPEPDRAPETNRRRKIQGAAKKWEEKQRRWRSEWDRERLEMDRKLKEQLSRPGTGGANHSEVLKALSQALSRTEDAYLETADEMTAENPELALMGSCVLVMLMKGEDVYILNVGDSRAVLAQKAELDLWSSDLERISEEFEGSDRTDGLVSLQLSMDHSTNIEEEVFRIRSEHRDDPFAIANDRVKGSLKVTRAFGAGFLKQPKWNEALLEMFRIDYVGTSPYITCNPSLYHHKLGPKDRFLILSSDGLYQYFTNEEAVAEVELFIEATPDGDPAQHLVEEALFRAANKAGLDFHELLEIPQGDRRRYHDDISIIVISLEGRIWRSCL